MKNNSKLAVIWLFLSDFNLPCFCASVTRKKVNLNRPYSLISETSTFCFNTSFEISMNSDCNGSTSSQLTKTTVSRSKIKQIFVMSRAVVNPPIYKEKKERKKTKEENWCTKRHRKCHLSFSFSGNNALFLCLFFQAERPFLFLSEKEKRSLFLNLV